MLEENIFPAIHFHLCIKATIYRFKLRNSHVHAQQASLSQHSGPIQTLCNTHLHITKSSYIRYLEKKYHTPRISVELSLVHQIRYIKLQEYLHLNKLSPTSMSLCGSEYRSFFTTSEFTTQYVHLDPFNSLLVLISLY